MLLLSALSLVPVLFPDGSLARASPVFKPGVRLVVDDSKVVVGHEVWGEVVVESTGMLLIKDGGRLVADRVLLEGNARLSLDGGVLEVAPTKHQQDASISGSCALFQVMSASVVRVIGPDGGYDLPTSMGCSVGLDLTVGRYVQVSDSRIELIAGDGMSSPETLTEDDLGGREFAGGDVTLSLVQANPYDIMLFQMCTVLVSAGEGGRASDAEVPPDSPGGRLKGLGGGYTRGGDVTGRVGSGGDVSIHLEAARLEISNAEINVSAGQGGDAADGACVSLGTQAGAGGGGYTGGNGASGLAEELGAQNGGRVSGSAGKGGDVDLSIKSVEVDIRTATLAMRGGDGGDAGFGGTSSGFGGGGGGGYSGGGGGSYWHMAGAPAGDVSGQVGRGGDVTVDINATNDMEVKTARVLLTAGKGGDAGGGGLGGRYAGGGGGGYSGGGGGGSGETEGDGAGNSGGHGSAVGERVGEGGSSVLNLSSPRLIEIGSWLRSHGGMGGAAGEAGATYMLPSGRAAGGGGAGGHSAGGGGGAGQSGQPDGEGGVSGPVSGHVCDGGSAVLDIRSERPSLHRNTLVDLRWGSRGMSANVTSGGSTRGLGEARETYEGGEREHIPMSEVMLYAPADAEYLTQPPRFDWMPVYRSTTNGDVSAYHFELATDTMFNDMFLDTEFTGTGWKKSDLPMGTYYWKVTAVYTEPREEGPKPQFHWFRFFNAPPVIMKEPTEECLEGATKSIYIANLVHDPDTSFQNLCVTCEHPGVESVMGMFLNLRYLQWVPKHDVFYNVSDGTSTTTGVIHVIVLEQNKWPTITDVGGYDSSDRIEMFVGDELYLEVHADDPNGDPLDYSVTSAWETVEISKMGSLHVVAREEDIGPHLVSVVVDDDRGGKAYMKLTFYVKNLPEPPGPIEVFAPKNHSKWKEGEEIAFTVKVVDPDTAHGEVLNVTWTSDISGPLGTMGTQEMANLRRSDLPVGTHHITITVFDGTHERKETLVITVVDKEEASEPPDRSNLWLYLLFAVIFLMMVAIGYVAGTRGVRDAT